ncbi:MAG: DUF2933 domain-containing protein [Chloroflexi bacterium]|nr:DUF2933 domain-containing protein [Chloroflexota bacterium]
MMKMCWNWKVLAGLTAVGVGIFAVAPSLALAAAPFLLMAACPLSMVLMMKGMGGMQQDRGPAVVADASPRTMPVAALAPNPEERLAQLQAEMERVQAEQAALAREIEAERAGGSAARAVQAEPLVRGAAAR